MFVHPSILHHACVYGGRERERKKGGTQKINKKRKLQEDRRAVICIEVARQHMSDVIPQF